MADEAKIILFAEGWIRKKVPSGLCVCTGMRPWQNRYWILTNKALKYYSEQVTVDDTRNPTGVIPLLNISRVEYLPDKRVGCRFDITVRNRRVYALDASTPDEAKGWVLKIKKAVVHSQTEAEDAKRDKHELTTDVLSALQELFFRARFGDMALAVRRAPKTEDEKKLAQVMRTSFATDADVLRYMLCDVMDPKHGLFDYDVTTDAEVEQYEKEQEKKRAADAAAAAATGGSARATIAAAPSPTAAVASPSAASSVSAEAMTGNPDDLLAGAVVVTVNANKRGSAFAIRASTVNNTAGPGLNDAKHAGGGGGGGGAGNPANMAVGAGGSAPPAGEGAKRVVDLLRSGTKEFVKAVQTVFTTKDTVAHGLAVKVLWTMYRGLCLSHGWSRDDASEHFYNVVRFHAQGLLRFNHHVRQAMYTLLCSPLNAPHRDVDKATTVSFFMSVLHHECWKCLFACAAESDMDVRRVALEDVTTLLHENYKNAKSIVRSKEWQSWMYLLLTDVPRNEQTKTHKQVYGFVLNALTLIHHAYFHDDLLFPELTFDSLQALHAFAGLNNGSALVAQTILSALLNKLFHGRATITADTDYNSIRWQNVLALNRVVKRYVFQTAYWRSTTAAEDEKDRAIAREEADKQRRELAAAGVPVGGAGGANGAAGARAGGGVGLEEIGLSDLGALGGQSGGKTTAEERARMVEVMERKRREAEETYVLAKARTKPLYAINAADETLLITEYGLHWNDKGEASDVILVELMKKLLKALRVDEYDPSTVSPTTTAQEKLFLQKCKGEAEFWRDSASLMLLLKRHQIDDLKLYTYRKLSFVMQEWLRATSTSARESVISDMKFLLANKGASRGSTIVSSTSAAHGAGSMSVTDAKKAEAAGGAGATGEKKPTGAAARKRTKNDFE